MLTEENVREIRRLHSEGLQQKEIAIRFGFNKSTVHLICKGRTWKHVGGAS